MSHKSSYNLKERVVAYGVILFVYFILKFNKESGNQVEECKLRVAYVPPPQPPSPVREGSEEGSSPRASVSDNGTVNTTEYTAVSICDVLQWVLNIR